MSLAVTSSITWWFLRPLIAANMPRIMVQSLLRDLRDLGGVDTGGAVDGQDGLAVLLVDLLDDAGLRHVGAVGPGHGAAEEADGLAQLAGLGHVGHLLQRG